MHQVHTETRPVADATPPVQPVVRRSPSTQATARKVNRRTNMYRKRDENGHLVKPAALTRL